MYMHAIYQIRELFSYKGFNLIKVYFSVPQCMYMLSFVSMSGDTSGSSGCGVFSNTASAVMMGANMLQSISTRERNSRLCRVKWSPTGG